MIFALEGIGGTVVLLNGPMGCRFYHSTTSRFLEVRPLQYLPTADGGRISADSDYMNDWFFRQPRVPCTYLDGYDYVYGTSDKVLAALEYICRNVKPDIVAVVNSPGAALIGDDLGELVRKICEVPRSVILESPGYSTSFEEGYGQASEELIRQAGAKAYRETNRAGVSSKKVNLLGISIFHRYWEGDINELKRLFRLCGIDVGVCLCAGSGASDLDRLPEADLNVVVYPGMGLPAAKALEERHGTPYYVCDTIPIGFSSTEKIFNDICSILDVSAEALIMESERARAAAWYKIDQIYQSSGRPRGVRFCVSGSADQEKAYTAFLRDYLAMEPSEPEDAEIILSNANVISELILRNKTFCGIEISLPGMGYTDVIPKTHMGINGALFLTEQVLNGVMSRI